MSSPGEPDFEFLDDAPAQLTRPLALVAGRAYAATWLHVRLHRPTPVAHPPSASAPAPEPEIVTARRLYVLRDDGTLFGDHADQSLASLALEPSLAEPPRADRLWRRPAVERYRRGERPDPADVFARLEACYDAFVDFGRSLADQRAMCRLAACCSLATWLADAFAVLPYLWLSGERGSGKTQLGTVWALTSYLGETVLAGGSYPALRDLAQSGAALYFDDAEALAAGRRGDPLKRELLLAGNRRGARVAVKALEDEGWRTRWVEVHAPRAFSAIAPPDPILASRALVIPLSRTRDPVRGHRDPADSASWPCDRLALQDDLWALGLTLLPEAARAWRALDAEPDLVGREYEKWRPLLAVARLLAAHGLADLGPRLREVMLAYQDERADLVPADETTELLTALAWILDQRLALAYEKGADPTRLARAAHAPFRVPNWLVLDALQIAVPDGVLATRPRHAASVRIGQLMTRLRLRSVRTDRERGWQLVPAHLVELARAYGVPDRLVPDISDIPDISPAMTHPGD